MSRHATVVNGRIPAKDKRNLLRQITAVKDRISAERDELRRLLDELEELDQDCATAEQDIESAVDALSRLL